MIINTTLEEKRDQFPSRIIRFEQKESSKLFFYSENNVILQLSVLRDSMLRFRYTAKGYFTNDFSYALDYKQNHGYNKLDIKDEPEYYEICTNKIICHVQKSNMKITLFNKKKEIILDDEHGFHWQESYEFGGNIVKMTKKANPEESFYGLGDKSTSLNLKGKRFQNWVTDQYAFARGEDPLYKAIPFYIGLHHGQAYGIFFDNTFRSFFDFNSERMEVTSFWAEGGEMNYYFIYGPSMEKVVSNYTHLTGKPKLPPLWALGYHQCKWSYRSEEEFKGLAKKFRELRMPCDTIYLDIDYMDGYRCFTWNKEAFPNLKKMIEELKEDGFKTVAIIDPGIKIDDEYTVYKEALKEGYFCKRADGPLMKGKVWPGECNFPDFTNRKVRHWWEDLYKELIQDIGIQGIWNDMNEPAVMQVPTKTFPLDVRHNYDENPCSHRKAHNIYGMQMARATYHGVKKHVHPKRPFVITRAAYSGTQRYSSTWTGDNIATWEHLWIANVQMQQLSMSGFGFSGSDIGGFAERPSGELYLRWIQLATFHPFFRTHSSGQHGHQEPWSFGNQITDIVREYIELRYQLLPYLYTMFWDYTENGVPLLKPLVCYDQNDVQTHYRNDEFLFGSKILVCPILEENSIKRRMYLPKGRWYNKWTNKIVEGQEEFYIDVNLEHIPIFILEGAIIPYYPVQQYVGEKEIEQITLEVYFKNGEETSILYEDFQDGYDYKKGRNLLRTFKYLTLNNTKETHETTDIYINQYIQGEFDTTTKTFKINFIGLHSEIKKIIIDKIEIPLDSILTDNTSIIVKQDFSEIHLSV